jgi:hypothetical protein
MNIPETLKMPSLRGLGKSPQGILRNQSTRGFFGFEFKIIFICKIKNIWKLPSPFSRNTLISCSENSF